MTGRIHISSYHRVVVLEDIKTSVQIWPAKTQRKDKVSIFTMLQEEHLVDIKR